MRSSKIQMLLIIEQGSFACIHSSAVSDCISLVYLLLIKKHTTLHLKNIEQRDKK